MPTADTRTTDAYILHCFYFAFRSASSLFSQSQTKQKTKSTKKTDSDTLFEVVCQFVCCEGSWPQSQRTARVQFYEIDTNVDSSGKHFIDRHTLPRTKLMMMMIIIIFPFLLSTRRLYIFFFLFLLLFILCFVLISINGGGCNKSNAKKGRMVNEAEAIHTRYRANNSNLIINSPRVILCDSTFLRVFFVVCRTNCEMDTIVCDESKK